MLVKAYEGMGTMDQRRYSPSRFVSRINGNPDMSDVSGIHVKR
jgi:hypothetical protein